MAFGFLRQYAGLTIVPKTTSTANSAGDLDFDTANARLNLHNGTSPSPVVTIAHAAQGALRIKNKDLEANSLAIVDSADTTKKALWQASGATTGTSTTLAFVQTANRVITFPDATATLTYQNDPGSGFVLKSGDTMTGALTINTASNQLVLSSATNAVTINSGTSAAARTYTIPDMGTTANFVMDQGTQTINGAKTFATSVISSNFQSGSVNPASSGILRLANLDNISWRNAANSGNVSITVDANDDVAINNLKLLQLKLNGSTSGSLIIQAAAITTNYSLIMPATQGSVNSFLNNDGSGNLTWVSSAGTPDTNWAPFTLTWHGTGSDPTTGTIGNVSAQWRRQGPDMHIKYIFYQSTGGTNGSGTYYFDLPNSESIDTTVVSANAIAIGLGYGSILGSMYIDTDSTPRIAQVFSVAQPTRILFTDYGQNLFGASSSFFSTAAAVMSFELSVPIAGWSV